MLTVRFLSVGVGVLVLGCVAFGGSASAPPAVLLGLGQLSPKPAPGIEITLAPRRGGGPDQMERIKGITRGTDAKVHRVVIFSRTDVWYVQPFVAAPFTAIKSDGSFETDIHLGLEYAALIVDSTYKPPSTSGSLPSTGNGVLAVTRVQAK